MENSTEKKRFGRTAKIAIASAAVLIIAGASVYAVSSAANISEAEAKQIALAQVSGADQSHITKFIRDMDDGREEYDVEIIYDGYEYDFEISAKDGRIYDQSKELADNAAIAPYANAQQPSVTIEVQPEPQETPSASAPSTETATQTPTQTEPAQQAPAQIAPAQNTTADIGLEKAKSIALGQVSGASTDHIIAAYSDYDDGRLEYDVEIHYNDYEYDFEIDGATGKVLSKDIDRMDYDDYYYYD